MNDICFLPIVPIFLTTAYITDSLIINLSGRLQALEEGDLLITSTTTADSGKYTCKRANEAGSVSGEAYLTVLGNLIASE